MIRLLYAPLFPSGLLALLGLALLLSACSRSGDDSSDSISVDTNTLSKSSIPVRNLAGAELPDFRRIRAGDFPLALNEAMDRAWQAIDQIARQAEPATLENTLLAIERAGEELSSLAAVLHGLRQVDAEFEWQEVHHQLAPVLAEHASRVRAHPRLYQRLQELDESDQDQWHDSDRRLLAETLRSMRQAGAGLSAEDRQQLARIERQLAELSSLFLLNLERETQRFELHLDQEEQLAGLSATLIAQAARDARDRGHNQGWSFTLNAHSLYPFLRHSSRRELRQSLYQAWQRRAGGMRYGQVRDNPELIRRIATLRTQRAQLLGYPNHLELTLSDSSIGKLSRIEQMLDRLEQAAGPVAERELAKIRKMMSEDGIDDEPMPWDWWYYREQIASREPDHWHAPTLAQVKTGLFGLAAELWGLQFEAMEDLPRWHESVEGFAVHDHDGALLGWLYLDLLHRPGKAGGAWISQYPGRDTSSGQKRPLVAAMANLPPAGGPEPHRLETEQVKTLLHEFGHALHVLMSTVKSASLAGTRVPDDFVEFPALLFERWADHLTWHEQFRTDAESATSALQPGTPAAFRARPPLSGLETLEQIAATRIDLAFHERPNTPSQHLELIEQQLAQAMNLPTLLSPRHRHDGYASLFGGHRAGQGYRHLWSELLAADAFGLFLEQGVLDRASAERLRREILSRGNSRSPMASWEAFRGRPPQAEALIRERGLQDH